ncbi:ABC transporter permease [Ramlibacter sp.]|uniref:ABC transporter permease n=1 Tax=Ramlibacter sp. TaxID=1917967 RepID=UPI003D0CEBDB
MKSTTGALSMPRESRPSLGALAKRLAWPVLVRGIALLALFAWALATPGFFSKTSLLALLTTVAFIGCVAVGMTFITLTGNIMSFSLGVTLSAATMVFVAALPSGVLPAIALTLLFGGAVSGLQGWIVGYFRANPIIVSMAAMALITGAATWLSEGRGLYLEGGASDWLKGSVGPVPGPLAALLALTAAGQFVLSFTRLGRQIYLIGSNPRAARAAGIEPWPTIVFAYVTAGVFTAIAAVLIAARYGSGDMQHGIGYDYHAISAIVLGGTAIQGGRGSVVHTLVGALLLASVQGLLLLHGFSTAMQHLLTGLLVLFAILLQYRGGTR